MRIQQKNRSNKNKIIIVSAVIASIVLIGLIYYSLQRDDSAELDTTDSTRVDSDSTEKSNDSNSPSLSSSKDDPRISDDTPVAVPEVSVTPQAPKGTFVSNHRPNLDGSPAPNFMNSTCTTTAGAQCKITFTKGETSVSLPSQQADANGNVSWSWKLQDIGLTEGTWTVVATATNGDKSSTTEDPMKLEVSQ